MNHLPGFWESPNWTDGCWAVYQERRSGWAWIENKFAQWWHRRLGLFLPRGQWEEREAKQWPSNTGSYDAAEDEINWLIGAGREKSAVELFLAVREIRPEFLESKKGV